MRKFVDLHVKIGSDAPNVRPFLTTASKLGFSCICLASENSSIDAAREMSQEVGVDVAGRVDLTPRNANELMSALRRVRRHFEVVAVRCGSKAVARQAAKDHRVDVIYYPTELSTRRKNRFDRQEAALASEASCAYEINVSDLLGREPLIIPRLISIMTDEIELARRHDVPVVVSSGSGELLAMRDPRGLAAILDLMGVEFDEALDMVSINPSRIVKVNRAKMSPDFVAPGIRRAR
ncbi:MAG TPA: RNase P subunit p30 family protein [Patescibacteria group bacterium]|nr:RNase P subunit p30 family protein [Patescibacteria group bacterium]